MKEGEDTYKFYAIPSENESRRQWVSTHSRRKKERPAVELCTITKGCCWANDVRVDKNWMHSLSSLKIAVFLTSVQRCSGSILHKNDKTWWRRQPTSDGLSSCAIHCNPFRWRWLSVEWLWMFSTLKISISTLQQNKSSSQFRIRSFEVSKEREKERERD